MSALETVIIETSNGPVVINKSDFDPEKHKLYSPEVEQPKRTQSKKDKK